MLGYGSTFQMISEQMTSCDLWRLQNATRPTQSTAGMGGTDRKLLLDFLHQVLVLAEMCGRFYSVRLVQQRYRVVEHEHWMGEQGVEVMVGTSSCTGTLSSSRDAGLGTPPPSSNYLDLE